MENDRVIYTIFFSLSFLFLCNAAVLVVYTLEEAEGIQMSILRGVYTRFGEEKKKRKKKKIKTKVTYTRLAVRTRASADDWLWQKRKTLRVAGIYCHKSRKYNRVGKETRGEGGEGSFGVRRGVAF